MCLNLWRLKFYYMYKCLKYILFISMSMVFCGCGDESEDEPQLPPPNSIYYVRYEATVTSPYPYIGNNITYSVTTPNGLRVFESGKSFSQTFGPMEKGFNTSITADASTWSSAGCNVRIYVSRDNEPFALKASNSGDRKVSVRYVINY